MGRPTGADKKATAGKKRSRSSTRGLTKDQILSLDEDAPLIVHCSDDEDSNGTYDPENTPMESDEDVPLGIWVGQTMLERTPLTSEDEDAPLVRRTRSNSVETAKPTRRKSNNRNFSGFANRTLQKCLLIEVPVPITDETETILNSSDIDLGLNKDIRTLLVEWCSLTPIEDSSDDKNDRMIILFSKSAVGCCNALCSFVLQWFTENHLLLPILSVNYVEGKSRSDKDTSTIGFVERIVDTFKLLPELCLVLLSSPGTLQEFVANEQSPQPKKKAAIPLPHIFTSSLSCRKHLAGYHTKADLRRKTTLMTSQQIDEARARYFETLCTWYPPAQHLKKKPRRPRVCFQSGNYKNGWLQCGLAIPATSLEDVLVPSSAPRTVRTVAATVPHIGLYTEGELQVCLQFLKAYFSPTLFFTAVNVMESHKDSYVSPFAVHSLGYRHYRLVCRVRVYVDVTVEVNVQALFVLLRDGVTVPSLCQSELASRVLPELKCACTPRSFEKQYTTPDGRNMKMCRHMPEVIYYFLNRFN
ncbi:hypothetical protein ADEAN_000349100 [Angomonas deanei]|uniref:Uncharacterized protein n=1 Tax=Angomonas deanei TaxID=59799 RepID=A0A7G2CBC2_9TRYP|nr:hypothetical protein ADEAN_000349100 [Angomonas deanei]